MTDTPPLVAIADDSPEDRLAVRRFLAQDPAGYRFVEYEGAADTVAGCRAHPPDCLILDYDLGTVNGLDVLARLADDSGVPPFAVLFLTGRGNESVAVRAMKLGASDYLIKGDDPEQLRRTVAEAIRRVAARPAAERAQAMREREQRATGDPGDGREWLVLIVDDSPEDRLAARRALGKGGRSYRFLEENTGTEGLSLCRTAGLDCLLLDYSLPDMTGLEFLVELTRGTGIPPFPVVMLTGRGSEAVAVQALKLGATDYLVKGRFTPEVLDRTVAEAVDRLAVRRVREEQRVRTLERLEAEARRRAELLAEQDRRKDEFLAMLAHELRNPLAPISSALGAIRYAGVTDGVAKALDIADRQVRHMARLVDDLLEVSRITRGKVELKRQPTDLVATVRRAVDAARGLFDARRQQLAVDLPAEPVWLHADPVRLEQVFANILNNAAKYTPPEGWVGVRLAAAAGEAVVAVTDTGVGIDADTLPRVFDLFAQASRSIDRSQGGLGIGLSLVKRLVEMHGGTVDVRSDGPGRGSEFAVRLPAGTATPPAAAGPAAAGGVGRLRVVVVDDNRDGAESTAMLVRSWGHEVHVAFDGPSGLNVIRRVHPDVAFVDIGLPGLSGYELAAAVTAEFGEQLPLLASVTGYGKPEDRVKSRQAGFRHHIVKPASTEDLQKVLDSVGRPAPAPTGST